MSPVVLLAIFCGLIVVASLAGGWIPLHMRLTHRRMEHLVSFVSGVMLGVAILHMLPHAKAARAHVLAADGGHEHSHDEFLSLWLLAGLLAMFFVERFFCFHHHEATDDDAHASDDRRHQHHHELTWTGAAIGLTVHSLIAGVALAASALGEDGARLAGLSVFLAILLHKPFDSLTLGTLMAAGRWSRGARRAVNTAFALVVPIGAAAFLAAGAGPRPGIVSGALAFSAGTFLVIALSDLLPELQFHRHDRIGLSAMLVAGLVVAYLAGKLEMLNS